MKRPSMFSRTSIAAIGAGLAVSLLLSACTSASSAGPVTITSQTTVSGKAGSSAQPTTGNSTGASGSKSLPGSSSSPGSSGGSTAGPTSGATGSVLPPNAQPDGFVPTKLKPGEKPPQFIVVSFDGVGWHEKWQYWMDIERKVPFHFTGFLSGTYMLSDQTKTKYQGPGHSPGKSSIGWNSPSELPVEIDDLNKALAAGDEIGTHFNGHFCSGADPSGAVWDTGNWNDELDQFFGLVKNVNANNGLSAGTRLNLTADEIKGGRTPCLEGHIENLFPAMKAHGMTYDSTFTRRGIGWPTQSKEYKIWQMGMAEFPIHGTTHYQITMDYNFYYTQENASSKGVSAQQSASDSAQVLATYQDMYSAAFSGNRAPLILGNHFNSWNNNAYSDAIGNFVLANCGKPDTKCVPFRDVIAWMNVQDPAVLAKLQAQAPAAG